MNKEGRRRIYSVRVYVFSALAFLVVFFLPRVFQLDQFMATDEGVWLFRSANFYYALGQRDFEKTMLTSHPGVVPMWVGTAALLVDFPEYRGLGQGYFKDYLSFEAFIEAQGYDPLEFLVTSRMLMLVLVAAVLTVCFLLSIRLFGFLSASIGYFLVLFDPLFLGMSRTFHLDVPMAIFSLLALLLFVLYRETNKKQYWLLVFSGFSAGFAILSKLTGGILVFSIIIIEIIWLIKEVRIANNHKIVKVFIYNLLIFGLSVGIILIIFFPAMWHSPINTAVELSSYGAGTAAGIEDTGSQFVASNSWFFYNPLYHSYWNYINSFLWRTTPIILMGIAIGIGMWFYQKRQNTTWKFIGLMTFVVVYTIIMSVAVKQSQKYFIPVHIILDLMAGLGFGALIKWLLETQIYSRIKKLLLVGIIGGIVIIQLGLVMPTFPYYFTYYNPLLGGGEKAGETIFVGTGEGLDQVGTYLNEKEHPEALSVLSWYGIGCLSYYFDGEVNIINHDNHWSDTERALLSESDYLVTYTNEWFRNNPEELLSTLEEVKPEYSVWINHIEYARVYDVATLPPVLFDGYYGE